MRVCLDTWQELDRVLDDKGLGHAGLRRILECPVGVDEGYAAEADLALWVVLRPNLEVGKGRVVRRGSIMWVSKPSSRTECHHESEICDLHQAGTSEDMKEGKRKFAGALFGSVC